MKRRTFLSAAVVTTVLFAAGFAVTTTDLVAGQDDPSIESTPEAGSLDTAAIQRGRLSTEREFKAAVSFGDKWNLNTTASGTITDRLAIGTTVNFGETLVRIDDKPLVLAAGTMPIFRTLEKVDTNGRDENGKRLRLLTGNDVSQLQQFLLDAGFDANGKLEADGIFGGSTQTAVKAWQTEVGLPVTGSVDSAQLIFSPEPVRIASEPRIGADFGGLEVTTAESKLLVDTSNRDRAALPIDSQVEVTLPDGTTLAGSVADQKQTAQPDGSTVWRTTIAVTDDLPGTASTVTVTVTEVVADDALLVPVSALLALAEGGFAVELPTGATTRLVRVEVGEVLDGRAAITGDVSEGDEVVIPS